MSVRIAVAIIAICPLIFAAMGAGFGWMLGTYLPGYYRAVFRGGDEPGFDPLQAGIGLGLTQGFGGGIVVAVIIIAIFVWRDVQIARLKPRDVGD